MKQHLLLAVTALTMAAWLAPAVAQTQTPAGAATDPTRMQADAQPQAEPPADVSQVAGDQQDQSDQQNGGDQQPAEAMPVQTITSVEVMRSAGQPVLDIVRVRGLTTADGWSDPELIPIGPVMPADGILDLVLVAVPPTGEIEANGPAPIEAILPLESGHPYKGFRVRSANNAVVLQSLPGLVEARLPEQATAGYTGKRFLAKGEAMPAGLGPSDVVREEDLPAGARVIHSDGGISDLTPNPDRLTLLIGADGRINEAFWN